MGLLSRAAGLLTKKPAPEGRILAYHGSPYTFDRFDLSKIGTGEGAQAYGHGLYFAGEPETAKAYRDTLGAGRSISIDGEPFTPGNYSLTQAVGALHDKPFALEESLSQWIARNKDNPYASIEDSQRLLDALRGGTLKVDNSGRLYEVDLPEGPYLDWDKPLGEQNDLVKDVLGYRPNKRPAPATDDLEELLRHADGADLRSGAEAYRGMAGLRGDPLFTEGARFADASAQLNERGIPGIRYLDQGSRSAGEGSHNYVIFNDKDVNLRAMLSALLAMGGGGGLLSYAQRQGAAA